ncbi:ribbon-helix-helix domain-containing protein [Pseudodesulfovibrio sp. zrk46]|uniref:ribbon-helix-helix domain-containing protein n=1 Tax=Pseudodesulfovibrio sp. zrk46 TaxID=2725288 RepID=UPI00144A0086|nr:ribbon-helix-helix domain-containing protein [Pseudodesulfovibrio sp. zrk46]QJB57114.1 DNA-binding protein [Pseudodesulfovibrio sp. zrk46]
MCEIYSSTPPSRYEAVTRSVRLYGGVTSVRLERGFWDILEEIAASEGVSLAKFLENLHEEAMNHHGEISNFASLLRVVCTTYLRKVAPGLKQAV